MKVMQGGLAPAVAAVQLSLGRRCGYKVPFSHPT